MVGKKGPIIKKGPLKKGPPAPKRKRVIIVNGKRYIIDDVGKGPQKFRF